MKHGKNLGLTRLAIIVIVSTFSLTNLLSQEIPARRGVQVVSPEIADNNTVTFNLYSADAQSVVLNGSWMG
ncbi:MAG TPA: esterase, partial [Bacteroidetes bacterium]|nr:esterase [Bacteroidota bacterium]